MAKLEKEIKDTAKKSARGRGTAGKKSTGAGKVEGAAKRFLE